MDFRAARTPHVGEGWGEGSSEKSMTQGRDQLGIEQQGGHDAPAALTPFDDPQPEPTDDTPIDPWGADDPAAFAPRREGVFTPTPQPQEPQVALTPRRRGGGILTIPLRCLGIATIACVTLLPIADENHQLAWEREKLRADLKQLEEQGRVNDEFLQRVADDPTLAERLANRQMKYIREGNSVLPLRGGGKEEMSPFHLVSVPPPPPKPPYQPVGGALATLIRQPRAQLYLSGAALLVIAASLILGHTPKSAPTDPE
jgi:hypothetical protein